MTIPGYAGKILYVDLSSGKMREELLNDELVRQFLGGSGVSMALARDLISPDVDPLAPENAIILGAGPFAGTIVPGGSKLTVTTKYPLNGAFATAAGGGNFALMMKSAGFDQVVITGRAEKPVFLKLGPVGAEVCDARDLWGKDTFETTDTLRSLYEPCSVVAMGVAGENLVKVSVALIDKGGTVGAGGLPAIMGAKNLKAIVAAQGEVPLLVADPMRLTQAVAKLLDRAMAYHLREKLVEEGALGLTANWRGGGEGWTGGGDIGALAELHRCSRRAIACSSCPMADKERIELSAGEYAGLRTYYTAFMGANRGFGATNVEQLYNRNVKHMDAENRYGLDSHNYSRIAGTISRLYREGAIMREDTGGLELDDSLESSLELMRMTAHREGIGDALAEGIPNALRKLGQREDVAVSIKGYATLFEPRLNGMGTMEFEMLINPRGGVVASGALGSPSYNPGRQVEEYVKQSERLGVPQEAMERIFGTASFNAARLVRYAEDFFSLFNCLSLCHRLYISRFHHVRTIAEMYSALTGIETTAVDLLKAGERAWNLWKILNVKAGFGRRDDDPPEEWFVPLQAHGEKYTLTDYYRTTNLSKEDIARALDEYYDERGWDPRTTAPTAAKQKELGL